MGVCMPYKDPEAARAYREAHKEEARTYSQAYRATHKEELSLSKKIYYEEHKNEIRLKHRTYYESHKEEIAVKNKAYAEAHSDEITEYKKRWSDAHKEELRARRKENYSCNKEVILGRQKVYRVKHIDMYRDYGKAYYSSHREECSARSHCYYKLHQDEIKRHVAAYRDSQKTVEIVCIQCGKHTHVLPRQSGKFCSNKCARMHMAGPNHPGWKNGVSYEPYCPRFNNTLKEKIRDAFDRKCFLSGIPENGTKLCIHHCDYLKSQGCQGQRWSLLPLNTRWHVKTNFNRWYWFGLLRDYWAYKYLTFHGMDIFPGPDRTAWLWEIYNNASDDYEGIR
jgi:hypothetical protein